MVPVTGVALEAVLAFLIFLGRGLVMVGSSCDYGMWREALCVLMYRRRVLMSP